MHRHDRASRRGAAAMCVGKERTPESRIAGWAFCIWPAIVRTGNAIIDFLPCGLTYVIYEKPTGAWLEGKGKGITQSERPYSLIIIKRRPDKRIVTRNRAI
jgi:hypothetical protein